VLATADFVDVLSRSEQEIIHRNILRILGEIGLEIANDRLLTALAEFGADINFQEQRAVFPDELVESFLEECPKVDWSARQPRLAVRAGCFLSRLHVVSTNRFEVLTEDSLHDYWRLAKALPNVDSYFLTGLPWRVDPAVQCLYERFYAWKWGIGHSAILYPLESSPILLDLYETYAGLRNKETRDVFQGGIFMMSPLKIAAEEAAQLAFWWERGFRVGVAHMTTGGLSAPATLAGLVTMNIAEALAVAMLQAALYGDYSFAPGMMASMCDMRTLMRPYGRPEAALANMMGASMARFYSAPFWGQTGTADAKLPSVEAGNQKVMATLAMLLAGGDALIDAGVLALDEVISPVQLILDNELGGALKRFLHEFEVTDESIGFDTMKEMGTGGVFTGTEHTVKHFRDEIWLPDIWTSQMLPAWEASGAKLDVDLAAERYPEIMATAPELNELSEEEEQVLLAIIKRAEVT